MNVAEYAEAAGVSQRRVRVLAKAGAIRAHRAAGRWVIEETPERRRTRRALSSRSQRALVRALHSRSLDGLTGQVRSRTAARLRLLRTVDDPAELLMDWWAGVAPEHLDGGSNLVVHAVVGNRSRVREVLHRPRREYLRDPTDLARVLRDERAIRGLTRSELAERADVDRRVVVAIERGKPLPDIVGIRKVLRAIAVEPVALPPLAVR